MTHSIARATLRDDSTHPEERRMAYLWLRQREIFGGDRVSLPQSEPLMATIGELLAMKRH